MKMVSSLQELVLLLGQDIKKLRLQKNLDVDTFNEVEKNSLLEHIPFHLSLLFKESPPTEEGLLYWRA